ncbi:hypothetical protein EVC08_033 [Rhizobium phage RHph_N65]|nr:hypothetical protein EVC08_033 [Rhizobium phage RHph_N65]
MIDQLPDWAQTLIFIGLIVLWLRLIFDFGRWLIKALTDEGMM